MREAEVRLFENFVRCSDKYLEFGSGGSTCLAARFVAKSVTSIDSSRPWQDAVADYCASQELPIQPKLIHADIGPTGEWGYPVDPTTRDRWPSYHRRIWNDPTASDADLYFIDGRFRVACFMQAILYGNPDTILILHDFRSREHYHVVREVAREVATAEDLSVFQPRRGNHRQRAMAILRSHEFDCA